MSKALVIKGADFSANKVATVTFVGVHTESISISSATITATEIGATYQLSAAVVPSDSVDAVAWASSDSNVATVQDGLVTITGCGTCNITASSGSYSAFCAVTVEVELQGFTVEPGLIARPVNSTNDVPGWWSKKSPISGTYQSTNIAATMASDPTQTRLTCDNSVMTDTGSSGTLKPESSRASWSYQNYGWTVPVTLPNNCRTIKVYSLNADYGTICLFYKSDVVSEYYTGYVCSRKVTGWTFASNSDFSNGPWIYDTFTEYSIPDGYDSIIVNWYIPQSSASSPVFGDMTPEQLASFRIICC